MRMQARRPVSMSETSIVRSEWRDSEAISRSSALLACRTSLRPREPVSLAANLQSSVTRWRTPCTPTDFLELGRTTCEQTFLGKIALASDQDQQDR